jgi:PAS domain S-box-containing protein
MSADPSLPLNFVNVRGTELLASDTRERYRQKLARITLDSMVQFVGLLDAEGTVLEINQVALDAVGIMLSDVEGKPFWTTFWWQVSPEVNATLKESILRASQGEFVRWDAEIFGRAGGTETIIIDASLMPVKDVHGNVVFITAEGRDITEKKAHEREIARQREELAKLDVLKTQFFANISHEFRTPLTLMLGPLEDALANAHGILPLGAAASLSTSHRNGLRLLKLVNTMLDFSRIEAGRLQAYYQPIDLSAYTEELASNFQSLCGKAGLRLIVDCAPVPLLGGGEAAYVDLDMWEKIVLNLLSNAFKFTLEGEIELRLAAVDGYARLIVRDTGVGIPSEELPRMFERFHRIERSRGRTHEGTGIGLALVQELVKLHAGTITVESKLGKGSTFTVTIPLGTAHLRAECIDQARTIPSTAVRHAAFVEEALRWLPDDVAATVEMAEREDARTPQTDRPRILWADDNADMRAYVSRLLRSRFDVEAVPDGEAALAAVRAHPPDLVLSDVMMPKLDGFGLLCALREDPMLREIPIILLSARAGEESRIDGMRHGADDYLVKPFSARELIARVDTHVKASRMRSEAKRRLERANDDLQQFAYSASHDLQEPLRSIKIYSELLQRDFTGKLGPNGNDYIRQLIDCSERMEALLRDLRTYTHASTAEQEAEEEVDAGVILKKALANLSTAIHDSGASIRSTSLPRVHIADFQLEQVFQNLIANAIRYRRDVPPHISISAHRQGSMWRFSVEDNGIGIEPEYREQIFGIFKRLHSLADFPGTGMGLAICKRIVERVGGRIWVESEPGNGSTFYFTIPIRVEESIQSRRRDTQRW